MILVTGGTGLVGAHLLLHLATKGEAVRALYRNEANILKTKEVFVHYEKIQLFDSIDGLKAALQMCPH